MARINESVMLLPAAAHARMKMAFPRAADADEGSLVSHGEGPVSSQGTV